MHVGGAADVGAAGRAQLLLLLLQPGVLVLGILLLQLLMVMMRGEIGRREGPSQWVLNTACGREQGGRQLGSRE